MDPPVKPGDDGCAGAFSLGRRQKTPATLKSPRHPAVTPHALSRPSSPFLSFIIPLSLSFATPLLSLSSPPSLSSVIPRLDRGIHAFPAFCLSAPPAFPAFCLPPSVFRLLSSDFSCLFAFYAQPVPVFRQKESNIIFPVQYIFPKNPGVFRAYMANTDNLQIAPPQAICYAKKKAKKQSAQSGRNKFRPQDNPALFLALTFYSHMPTTLYSRRRTIPCPTPGP